MTQINNPLNIQEKKLFRSYLQIVNLFQLNNLEYLIEYTPRDKETNPHLFISIDYKDIFRFGSCAFHHGRIRYVKYRSEREEYYLKEGFESDFISQQDDVWSDEVYSAADFLLVLCPDFEGSLKLT